MFSKKYITPFALLILFAAGVAIYSDFIGNHQLYSILKPLTTILIILFTTFFGRKNSRFYKLVLLALCFCLLGDTLLLYESYFIWGLVAFLIAHVLFTLSFISINGFKTYLIPLIGLLTFGVFYYWSLYESLEGLKIPVLVYVTAIIMMSWQGMGLRIWKKSEMFALLFCAVLLFLISDSILAWAKFKQAFKGSGVLILTTYWASIFLIALATTKDDVSKNSQMQKESLTK